MEPKKKKKGWKSWKDKWGEKHVTRFFDTLECIGTMIARWLGTARSERKKIKEEKENLHLSWTSIILLY